MKQLDLDDRLAHAERAVALADEEVRSALQVLGAGARPRLAQSGIAAVAVGVVGAMIVRRGHRSGSRLSKAIDYSVLLPLAASLIPRIVSTLSSPRATTAYPPPTVDGRMR